MAPLPPLFIPQSLSTSFQRSQGLERPDLNSLEPGMIADGARADIGTCFFPEVAQVTDAQITGTFNSTGTWRLTVIPITSQNGSAAAAGMSPAYVEVEADDDSAADVITALIAAVTTGATATTNQAAAAWSRLKSYVSASAGAATDKIRLTSVASGQTFTVEIEGPAAGDSYALTSIASPVTDTVKVGLYYAIDTTKGNGGYDSQGRPFIKKIASSTPASQIIGPIFKGDGTEAVEPGFAYREYKAGSSIPHFKYGHGNAYGEKAIALATGPSPVYVRHTDTSDGSGLLAGMVTDAAGAAAGATANLWTGSITAADATVYRIKVMFGSHAEEFTYTSSSDPATQTEIGDALRALLNASAGLSGLTFGGTTTLTITGPADGRSLSVENIGPGVIAFVETDEGVTTHTLLTRGDKFLRKSNRTGAVMVDVPVTPAA